MGTGIRKPVTYLIAISTVVLLYVAGMTMALFGPSPGRLLGVPAFLATVFIFIVLNRQRYSGTLRCLAHYRPAIVRFRPVLQAVMVLCGLVVAASLFTLFASARSAGVAQGTHPVFDHQREYKLNNHGRYTTVTRTRYLIVGSSFVVGWHTMGTLFALFSLHLALFGKMSPASDRGVRVQLTTR